MPQITVDYSGPLTEAFDRRAFAFALRDELVATAKAKPEACKTHFRRTEDVMVGSDTDGHAIVHVWIGMLTGRTTETKNQLTEAVLELVRTHVKPVEGLTLHASVEVRELDDSYRKFDN